MAEGSVTKYSTGLDLKSAVIKGTTSASGALSIAGYSNPVAAKVISERANATVVYVRQDSYVTVFWQGSGNNMVPLQNTYVEILLYYV